MLQSLFIENIAVVKSAQLDFVDGMTVLTGETGAGKSVIIDSLNAVLGQKTSRDSVRHGAEKAFISASFTAIPASAAGLLSDFGIESCGELVISRELAENGKSAARINGRPVTAQMLQQLGALLINIHGQHDNQELLDEEKHIDILDRVGGLEKYTKKYRAGYERLKTTKGELDRLKKSLADRDARLDYLKYQIEELEAADIKVGEREALSGERKLIMNSEKVAGALETVRGIIAGGDDSEGAESGLSEASKQLETISGYCPEASAIGDRLGEMSYALADIRYALSDIEEKLNFDPDRQTEIEDRLAVLDRIRRKYGDDEQKVLEQLSECRKEYDELSDTEAHSARLEKEYEEALSDAHGLAEELTSERRRTANSFIADVEKQLAFLEMPNVKLGADFETVPLGPKGEDRIVFLISANLGEPLKSISKIASGGELSRVMLAIKSVMSDRDGIPTLIFDEIDSGVSGKAASKIGLKLKQVSRGRQVICVTHLAQIAAYADGHMLVEKTDRGGETETRVKALGEIERVDELARILGGTGITEAARANARELIREAMRSLK